MRRLVERRARPRGPLVHRDPATPCARVGCSPRPRGAPPPHETDGGGGCVGCAMRNWVRQTRGRPSQAEARESSRRFRLEAVPWKPPRSPSSLRQSADDPSLSPSIATSFAIPRARAFRVHPTEDCFRREIR